MLFIDEIHRLAPPVEEILYPAMEDFQIDIVIGKGPTARSVRLDVPRFTLVGATTRTGLVTGPLRDRFGFVTRLEHYAPDELEEIVRRTGNLLAVECAPEGAAEIARRARGTPRLAIRLLRRVRDFVEVRGEGVITLEAARAGCDVFGIDEQGLDRLDRQILEVLCIRFAGRPVGSDDARRERRRGARDDRGRLRAVPAPGGFRHAHAARPDRGPCRLVAPRAPRATRRHRARRTDRNATRRRRRLFDS